MNEELINEVLSRLDGIGAELSKGAAFGYEVLVRQQIIEGIIGLVVAVVCAVIFVATTKFAVNNYKDFMENKLGKKKPNMYSYSYDMTDWAGPIGLPVAFVLLFSGITGLVNFSEGLKHLINPHYYAIYEILERVPG